MGCLLHAHPPPPVGDGARNPGMRSVRESNPDLLDHGSLLNQWATLAGHFPFLPFLSFLLSLLGDQRTPTLQGVDSSTEEEKTMEKRRGRQLLKQDMCVRTRPGLLNAGVGTGGEKLGTACGER